MKKVLSLVCAALIAFSASAIEKAGLRTAPQRSFNGNVKKELVKKATPEQLTQAPRRVAQGEVVEVVAVDFGMSYYDDTKDWYVVLTDEEGYLYVFDIFSDSDEMIELDSLFTLKDMDLDYSFLGLNFFGQLYKIDTYTDANIKFTLNENGLLHVEANVSTDESGDYHIVYDQPEPPTPIDSVDFVSTNLKINTNYLESDGILELTANNVEGEEFALDVYALESVSGNYTTEDLYYGYIGESEIYTIDINVNAVENIVTGELLAWNGTVYFLNLTYVKPEANDTVVIKGNDVIMDDYTAEYGWWQAMYEGKEYYVSISNNNFSDQMEGIYYTEDLDDEWTYVLDYRAAGDTIAYLMEEATIEVSILDGGDALVVGEILARNDDDFNDVILFQIELTCPLTDVENVAEEAKNMVKVLRNGQVLIRKNNKVYTVLGQEVK